MIKPLNGGPRKSVTLKIGMPPKRKDSKHQSRRLSRSPNTGQFDFKPKRKSSRISGLKLSVNSNEKSVGSKRNSSRDSIIIASPSPQMIPLKTRSKTMVGSKFKLNNQLSPSPNKAFGGFEFKQV